MSNVWVPYGFWVLISTSSRLGSFKVFISTKGIYLSLGSEIAGLIADSVSKDTFLLVQFKKFPNPSFKSNDIAYFFAYFHPLVKRLSAARQFGKCTRNIVKHLSSI